MKYLVILLLLFIGFIFALLFLKSKVEFIYDGKVLKLKIVNGFLKLKFNFPEQKKKKRQDVKGKEKKDSNDPEKKVEGFKNKYNKNKNAIKMFLKLTRYKIHFQKLSITLEYGSGNAATTGILYGVIWGIVSSIYNTLNLYFNAEYPEVNVTPDFHNKKFDIAVKGILRVRLVHIISAIIKIIYSEIKKNKEANERGK